MRATSLAILREPYAAFARLADGAVNPAWNFATWWNIGPRILGALIGGLNFGMTLFLAILAGLSAAVHVWLVGGAFYVTVRTLGGSVSASLAARTQGYATVWRGPAFVAGLLLDSCLSGTPLWWVGTVTARLILTGGAMCAFTAVARARCGFSASKAALAAAAPGLLVLSFEAALLGLWTLQRR